MEQAVVSAWLISPGRLLKAVHFIWKVIGAIPGADDNRGADIILCIGPGNKRFLQMEKNLLDAFQILVCFGHSLLSQIEMVCCPYYSCYC